MTALFASALMFFAGGVILHLLFTRLITNANFVRDGYVFLLLTATVSSLFVRGTGAWSLLFLQLHLIILWNLYTIFFINLMNSVSLRMMTEIGNAPSRSLSGEELLALYSDEEALQSRVGGLVSTGLLQRDGQELVLTGKGRVLAQFLKVIRKLFGIEFYG
jgi:hypothetical protein